MKYTMEAVAQDTSESRKDLRRASWAIIGLFWFLQFAELSLVSLAEGSDVAVAAIVPRTIVMVAGVLLMLGFVEIVVRLGRLPFRARLLICMAWALVFCLILVTINFGVFYLQFAKRRIPFDLLEYVYTAFSWSWFCLSIAGALLALSYNHEMRAGERRLAALEVIASRAQMAALRYQLNPHFLFNTLNSLASLIARHENEVAERMVENLADFLRATLELDPVEDIALEEEADLQRMYLAVEEQRFPDRLVVQFDIPHELARARVPALITQPLIENAIRHAVALSTDSVIVQMAASVHRGMLRIAIADDGRPLRAARPSTGVGIGNVASRLKSRFGEAQTLRIDTPPDGGFCVVIEMPLVHSA